MQATVEQPLENHEIVQHLAVEAWQQQSNNPQAPGYVHPHDSSLTRASYSWLVNRADQAAEPLVQVGEHTLSAESLMADADELKSWLDTDTRALRKAIENPDDARDAIWKYREKSGIGDSEASRHNSRTGKLSLEEAKAYLNTIRATMPTADQADRSMHDASIDVATALLDTWKHRQDPKGELEDGDIHLDLHAAPPNAGTRGSLYTHLLREQRGHEKKFHDINEARIRKLGKEVLDTEGIRGRIGESLSSTSHDEEKLLRAKEAHQKLNVKKEASSPRPLNNAEAEGNEEARLAKVEEAARNGSLLGWEPQGETREERDTWAKEKARQIRQLTLLPHEFRRLQNEQSALTPRIHDEGHHTDAYARYKELGAIDLVHKFQTNDPEIIECVLREMTPVLDDSTAAKVEGVNREVREAHARKPKAQFSFTFNRIQDESGSRTFNFLHTVPT